MRIAFRLRAAALAALALLASCSGETKADADPALWVLRDDDTTIYLFGTVHMLPPGLSWFDDGVRKAFDGSDQLVLELAGTDDGRIRDVALSLGTARDGKRLSDRLTDAERKLLDAARQRLGLPPDAFETLEPWLAAIQLSVLETDAGDIAREHGAETVLTRAASRAGKPVGGLETPEIQFGYFDRLSMAAQLGLLRSVLDAQGAIGDQVRAAADAWSRGDAEGIATFLNRELGGASELRRALLSDRNRAWSDWIAARMDKPGTVFVAVGAGHLAGRDSVQSVLARRGLYAERVAY